MYILMIFIEISRFNIFRAVFEDNFKQLYVKKPRRRLINTIIRRLLIQMSINTSSNTTGRRVISSRATQFNIWRNALGVQEKVQ